MRARSKMTRALDTEVTRHWLETLSLASADFTAASEPTAVPAVQVLPERVRGRFKQAEEAGAQTATPARRWRTTTRYAGARSSCATRSNVGRACSASRRTRCSRRCAVCRTVWARNRMRTRPRTASRALVADPGSHLPADTLFLMGRLAEHHVKETARARKDLARAWRKVRGRRWKALRAKMQEVSEKSQPPLRNFRRPARPRPSPLLPRQRPKARPCSRRGPSDTSGNPPAWSCCSSGTPSPANVTRPAGRNDDERPLSARGRARGRLAAAGLRRLVPRPGCVLTSPLLRTRETAAILAQSPAGPRRAAVSRSLRGRPRRSSWHSSGAMPRRASRPWGTSPA